MGFIDSLRPLFCHSVIWEPLASRDEYDAPTFSSPQGLTAYVTPKPQMVRSAEGREVVSNTTVYLDGVHGIGLGDRFTLPDGRTPPIIRVATYADENGDEFEEVLL